MAKNEPTAKFMIVSSIIWLAILAVVALVLCSCNSSVHEKQHLIESYRWVLPTVVTVQGDRIRDYDNEIYGMGTGFFVSNEYVLTMNHITNELVEGTIQLKLWNEQIISAKKVAVDELNDLALLQIDPNNVKYYDIPKLIFETIPEIGERVFIVGSPFLWDGSMTAGILSRRTTIIDFCNSPWACDVYLVDANIDGGNSGSPVFNARCGVMGIVTGWWGKFSVIIPSYSICCFLREQGIL